MRVVPRAFYRALSGVLSQEESVPPLVGLLDHIAFDEDDRVVFLRDEEYGSALGGMAQVPPPVDAGVVREVLDILPEGGVVAWVRRGVDPGRTFLSVRVPLSESEVFEKRRKALERGIELILDVVRRAGGRELLDEVEVLSAVGAMVNGGLGLSGAVDPGEEMRVQLVIPGLEVEDREDHPHLVFRSGEEERHMAVVSTRILPVEAVEVDPPDPEAGEEWWQIHTVWRGEGYRMAQVFLLTGPRKSTVDLMIYGLVEEMLRVDGIVFVEDFLRMAVFLLSIPMNAAPARLARVGRGREVEPGQISVLTWGRIGEDQGEGEEESGVGGREVRADTGGVL